MSKQGWKNNDGFEDDFEDVVDEVLGDLSGGTGDGVEEMDLEYGLHENGVNAEVTPGKHGFWYTFRGKK